MQELLEIANRVEQRLSDFEHAIASTGSTAGIAITKGHLSLSPANSNPILYERLSAAYHVRSLNFISGTARG
jgi:hypothetical protein